MAAKPDISVWTALMADFESGADMTGNPFAEPSAETFEAAANLQAFLDAVVADTKRYSGIDDVVSAVAFGAFLQGCAIGYEYAAREQRQEAT